VAEQKRVKLTDFMPEVLFFGSLALIAMLSVITRQLGRASASSLMLGMIVVCAQFETRQSICIPTIIIADRKLQTLEVTNWMAASVQHHSRAECV
jgi:hypothetical protein